jgi:predicted DNA-binding transcriptional regulator YafY
MMEQFLLEPVELTDDELDAVAGGATAAAAQGNFLAAAAAASILTVTVGPATITAGNASLAIGID